MTGARPARASSGARQARASSSSQLYCKKESYYWQYMKFYMMPLHVAMTGARPAHASSGARQARARRAQVLVRSCTAKRIAIFDNTWISIWCHFMLLWQARAQRAPRQARARRAQYSSWLYCEDESYYWQYMKFHTLPFHAAMTQARAQHAPRQARPRRAQVLVRGWIERTPAIIDNMIKIYNTFHMMPFHDAMTGARPARTSWGARQARAGSSSYCKDAGYYWQYNAFHTLPFHAAMTGARPARTSSGARQARAGSRVLPRRRLLLTIPDISYDATSCCYDRRAPGARLTRRAQYSSWLYCKDESYFWQYMKFHMMPLHAAMTQARAQRAPRQARARRAQVLVWLNWKDAGI